MYERRRSLMKIWNSIGFSNKSQVKLFNISILHLLTLTPILTLLTPILTLLNKKAAHT